MAGYHRDMKNTPGKGANHDPKIRLMRAAKTKVEYKSSIGGVPRAKGHEPRPVSMPKMPWDQPK